MSYINTKFSVGISRDSREKVNLEIRDAHSGDVVLKVDMTLEEYALVVTGLHGVDCEGKFNPCANIAKERVTTTVSCDKSWDKNEQVAIVNNHFQENYSEGGWVLHSDGTSSKQRADKHEYIIRRYADVGGNSNE